MSLKTPISEQPSIVAASISSVGKVWINWRIRKTPNGAERPGAIEPEIAVDQPKARHQREERDDHGKARDHHRTHIEPKENFASGKALLGKAIARHRGKEQLE